jgi:hypothetical protein
MGHPCAGEKSRQVADLPVPDPAGLLRPQADPLELFLQVAGDFPFAQRQAVEPHQLLEGRD